MSESKLALREAKALVRMQKYKEAVETLKPCIYAKAGNRGFLNTLAKAYMIDAEYRKAMPVLMQLANVAKDKPTQKNILLNLAICLRCTGKAKKALKILEKMLESEPDCPFANIGAALCCLEMNDKKRSEYYLNCTLAIAPANRATPKRKLSMVVNSFYLELAEYYEESENYSEALRYYGVIRNREPLNMHALSGIADCLFLMERYADAKKYYSKICSAFPDTEQGKFACERVRECGEMER